MPATDRRFFLQTPAERASPAMRVEVHGGPDELPWLRPHWEGLRARLAARGFTAGPFLSYDWAAVYGRSLAEHGTPRTFVAWRGAELVGVLPLLAERRLLAHLPAKILRSLSDDHSQRWDALVEDEVTARAMVERVLADRDWDAIELRDVPDDDSGLHTGAALIGLAAVAAGCTSGSWPSQRSPVLALPAAAAGGAKFRANLRRRARRLAEEVGPVVLERIDDPDALDEAFRLEAAGWKGDGGTAIACDPRLVARYRALAHALHERQALALYFLRAGGAAVAMQLAAVEDGTYYLLKVGSDPRFSRYGVGHLLVDEVARDLAARGARALDFLGDTAAWKREWTAQFRGHSFRYLFRPGLYRWILATLKLAVVPGLHRIASAREGRPTAQVRS